VNDPLLLNLSLPKCGTLSVHEYFGDRRSSHELYGHSFLSAIELAHYHHDPHHTAILSRLIQRRFQEGKLEIDTSGFLHPISTELIERYPYTCFLRVIRDPRSWISSYLDMLEAKAHDLTHEGRLLHDRAASFERFYLQRLDKSLQLADLLDLQSWSMDQRSKYLTAAAAYWSEHCKVALSELDHPQLVTCQLGELSTVLSYLRMKILPGTTALETRPMAASRRHNVSDQGPARLQLEQWLKNEDFCETTMQQLSNCDRLHQVLIDRLQCRS
jgi:hypothetical protein